MGFREAFLRKAHLRVVHVVPPAFGVGGAGWDVMGERRQELGATTGAVLDEQLQPLEVKNPGVHVEVGVVFGVRADELVAVSKAVTS